MIRRIAFALLLALSAPVLFAQDRAPSELFEATQCLVTGKYEWVDAKDQKLLYLAYRDDRKTFNGARYVYVIVFNDAKRNAGKIFDIRVKDSHYFSIENNAKFVIAPDKSISFPEPPLGGNWTQGQLQNSVEQILKKRHWYDAQVKLLLKPSPHLQCETVVEDIVHPDKKP